MTLAVVMCCYNGARFLAEQLSSIEAQSTPPDLLRVYEWESSDDTVQEIETFLETTALDAQMFQLGQARGVVQSFKSAISHLLRSEPDVDFVALCDQDDIWEPEKLELAVRALRSAGDVPSVFFSDVSIINRTGTVLAPTRFDRSLYFTARPVPFNRALFLANPVVGMTMVVSRDIAEKFVEIPESELFMHDWAMLLCGHLMNAEFSYSPRALVQYRQHSSNVLGARSSQSKLRLLFGMNSRMKKLNAQYEIFRFRFPDTNWSAFYSFSMIAHVFRAGFLRKRYRAVLVFFLVIGIISRRTSPDPLHTQRTK